MRSNNLAKRYATAIFSVSQKQGNSDLIQRDLLMILEAYKKNEKFYNFLTHNQISHQQKKIIIKNIFENKIENLTLFTLYFLLKKRRENLLKLMINEFQILYYQSQNLTEVCFTSAIELVEEEKQKLIEKFEQHNLKKVIPLFKIDPTLIGGIKIHYSGIQIDQSVKGKLNHLKANLLKEIPTPTLSN